MKEESLSSKQMLLNIWSMRTIAKGLTKKGKVYSELLEILLAMDYYNDDEIPIPSIKDLAKESKLSYDKVRRYISDIYSDLILDYENRPVFSFTKVRYEFCIRGWNKDLFMHMDVAQLPIVPRVGEEVSIPFFSAYLKDAHFYVEQVKHKFEEGAQVVEIWVRPGSYNSYWHFRKDKAQEENELPLIDFIELTEFELKRKLKVGKWH